MSEKIFAVLLRLYPARFRRQYGAESLQLLRDRLRDEPGLAMRFRLWFDLFADFFLGLPQAYRNSYALPTSAPLPQYADGFPAFRSLEQEPLRPGSLIGGGVVAIAALAAFAFVMNHPGPYHRYLNWERLRAAQQNPTQVEGGVEAAAERVMQQVRSAALLKNCTFEKIGLLSGNIGYVKLDSFPDPAGCRDAVDAVMARLNETDAIIFDLRDNTAGDPQMARLMAGWLFNHPAPWPGAPGSAQSVTDSPVYESQLAQKPVVILTSSRTSAVAEQFSANLQALQRATIVGESASGAAYSNSPGTHPGATGSNVSLSAPKADAQSRSVEPDVKVNPADALATAEKLALRKVSAH